MRDFGRADVLEVEASLFQPSHSVSAWCAAEVKLGSLGGCMEPPQCFGAEIYAQVGPGRVARGRACVCVCACVRVEGRGGEGVKGLPLQPC